MNKPSPMSILCEQTPVVILAGGKGTRLMPYTTSLPKPLMPVGEYPILDILLRQLAGQGFRRITLAVGHLAGLIQAYFKEGQEWGVELEYAYETTPLGTAGPIARLPRNERALLVLNCYLLTTMDFRGILRYHYENRAAATIGTKRRTESVPFGVIEAGANGQISQYKEKPSLDYLVSMGIYVFSPAVREFIPRTQKFDFPELVNRLLAHGQKVQSFETDAYWMDIGRPDDYQRANEEFAEMEKAFFKANVESAAVGTRI
jgi:NDP-sugar pyrophosphorylase family protein